ncbi:hypothetical protein [Actinoplanes sp. NPDC051411]|uniref:hypothetical protein n=1 Tax=Actinoplanes sp. NPDC051411 TaxID=3155522 RepID=UPI00342A2ED7
MTRPNVITRSDRPAARVEENRPRTLWHDHLAGRSHVGPIDRLSIDEVMAKVAELPQWPAAQNWKNERRRRNARTILNWLARHPGDGWQARWLASGADGANLDWLDAVTAGDPHSETTRHDEIRDGLVGLLLGRVVLPSYDMVHSYRANMLFHRVRQIFRPDLFDRLQVAADELHFEGRHIDDAFTAIAKVLLHTGKNVDQITTEDLFELRAWAQRRRKNAFKGLTEAWDLLRHIGVLPVTVTLRAAAREGQRPTAELVDRYGTRPGPIRDMLIRYFEHRRPAMDYSSFRDLIGTVVGNFWADIERHYPEIDTFDLPVEVADAWKQRLRFIRRPGKEPTPRRTYLDMLQQVRAVYLDLQEWALEDPSWAPWAVRSPVRRGETHGMVKHKKVVTAEMHQRVRERLPHLPVLVTTAHAHRDEQAALLTAAAAAQPGDTFTHAGRRYRRVLLKSHADERRIGRPSRSRVLVETVDGGERIDLTKAEDDAFWAWAVIETLRHTGVRIEELLGLTHLALVSYKLPDTGEVVPLLQIVPSKSNEERLLLVGPELASVLAAIVSRLRAVGGVATSVTLGPTCSDPRVPPISYPPLVFASCGPTHRSPVTSPRAPSVGPVVVNIRAPETVRKSGTPGSR